MQVMQTVHEPETTDSQSLGREWIDQLGERIAADQDARFAISLDRLAYARDSYQLGVDLVRMHVRRVADAPGQGPISEDATLLLRGLSALTGRISVLDSRYGQLAVDARAAGASLFDFQDDSLAREAVLNIVASDEDLALKVRERVSRAQTSRSAK